MLRQGVTERPPDEEESHPLFSAQAQAALAAITASDVWRYLKEGITAQREALFATPLNTEAGETLEARWGGIQQLTILLHGGPQLILQYAQLAATAQDPDRESDYVARAAMFEG